MTTTSVVPPGGGPSAEAECGWCGQRFEYPVDGPVPLYCKKTHATAAQKKRKALRERGAEGPLVVSSGAPRVSCGWCGGVAVATPTAPKGAPAYCSATHRRAAQNYRARVRKAEEAGRPAPALPSRCRELVHVPRENAGRLARCPVYGCGRLYRSPAGAEGCPRGHPAKVLYPLTRGGAGSTAIVSAACSARGCSRSVLCVARDDVVLALTGRLRLCGGDFCVSRVERRRGSVREFLIGRVWEQAHAEHEAWLDGEAREELRRAEAVVLSESAQRVGLHSLSLEQWHGLPAGERERLVRVRDVLCPRREKYAYLSRDRAAVVARLSKARPYLCRCGLWHVGHARGTSRVRRGTILAARAAAAAGEEVLL